MACDLGAVLPSPRSGSHNRPISASFLFLARRRRTITTITPATPSTTAAQIAMTTMMLTARLPPLLLLVLGGVKEGELGFGEGEAEDGGDRGAGGLPLESGTGIDGEEAGGEGEGSGSKNGDGESKAESGEGDWTAPLPQVTGIE